MVWLLAAFEVRNQSDTATQHQRMLAAAVSFSQRCTFFCCFYRTTVRRPPASSRSPLRVQIAPMMHAGVEHLVYLLTSAAVAVRFCVGIVYNWMGGRCCVHDMPFMCKLFLLPLQSTLLEAIALCSCKALHDPYGVQHFYLARMEEGRRLSKQKIPQPEVMADMMANVLVSCR